MKNINKILLISCLSTLCSCEVNISSGEESLSGVSSQIGNSESNIIVENGDDIDNKAQVIILLGQSNMEGTSYWQHLESHISKAKFLEYQRGYRDVKISYHIPWNKAQQSMNHFIPTALGQGGQDTRFGPEVGLAEYIHNKGYKNVYLVKYAYGGTTLTKNWRSPSSGGNVGELYTGAVEYALKAMEVLEGMNLYPEIQAICWMQGETDADGGTIPNYSGQYYDLQKNFMNDLRNDLAYYGNPNGIGFVDAGISDCSFWKFHAELNADKQRLSEESELNTYFSTYDLEYLNEPSYGADNAHYDSVSEIILGQRFGQNVDKYLNR